MRPLLRIVGGSCLVLFGLCSVTGCSSDSNFQASANVAGNYTVSVTDADNGCMIDSWQTGKSATGIPFVITQEDKDLNGTLQGLSGIALGLSIGTNMFTGTANGSDFALTAYGTISHSQGNCAYTLNAEISGSISGDAISGTIKYAPATSTNPDCASLQCSSIQNFDGTRPPS
jgi:hypothetical protein